MPSFFIKRMNRSTIEILPCLPTEGPAPELLPFIGDDIPGRAASVTNRFAEHLLNLNGRRATEEDGEADRGT
jgi:hypothetical protein